MTFKVGHISWNNGLKIDRIKYPNMGAFGKRTEEQKKNISEGHKGQKCWCKGLKLTDRMNENNPEWKGDKVGYRALHHWVDRRLGKPMCCDLCGDISIHRYHWANKSGNYKREITDWIRLCPKCHYNYDKKRREK